MRRNWGNSENPYSVTSASQSVSYGALTPENYLVTPYKLDCEEITFIACAQDAEYPAEHFGVAVSTTGNTDANDFTVIWETELTAKSPGAWYYYDVDLREYQGQDIYVAIVHFACSNQFMLNIDNVMLYRTYDRVIENSTNLVSIYPNPTTDRLSVACETDIEQYMIYDMTGSLVFCHKAGNCAFDIDVQELPFGIYLLSLCTKDGVTNKRFVKN
jgi:hypothetical protein